MDDEFDFAKVAENAEEELSADAFDFSEIGTSAESATEELEIEKEVEGMPEAEKEKMNVGFSNIGFYVERQKNRLFASVLHGAVEKNKDKKGTMARFLTQLGNSFTRDAENADKKMKEINEGKSGKMTKLRDKTLLFGNIVKYGRTITDCSPLSMASPMRYGMMAAMFGKQVAEASKEARLANEDVIEQTRIQDADEAADEAWKIYEEAQRKTGGNVSAESLEDAYLLQLPEDLQNRLANPSTANHFVQRMVDHVLKFDIKTALFEMEQERRWAYNNQKFTTDQERKEADEKVIRKFEKNLKDYDRIVTQYGTVDALALAGRYAETAGKAVIGTLTYLSVKRMFEKLSEAIAHAREPHLPAAHIKVARPIPEIKLSLTPEQLMAKDFNNLHLHIQNGDEISLESLDKDQIENILKTPNHLGLDPNDLPKLAEFARAHGIAVTPEMLNVSAPASFGPPEETPAGGKIEPIVHQEPVAEIQKEVTHPVEETLRAETPPETTETVTRPETAAVHNGPSHEIFGKRVPIPPPPKTPPLENFDKPDVQNPGVEQNDLGTTPPVAEPETEPNIYNLPTTHHDLATEDLRAKIDGHFDNDNQGGASVSEAKEMPRTEMERIEEIKGSADQASIPIKPAPLPTSAEELKAKIEAHFDNQPGGTSGAVHPETRTGLGGKEFTTGGKLVTGGGVTHPGGPISTEPSLPRNGIGVTGTPDVRIGNETASSLSNKLGIPTKSAETLLRLPRTEAAEVIENYQKMAARLAPGGSNASFFRIGYIPAHQILDDKIYAGNPNYHNLVNYVYRLQKVSGLKPMRAGFFGIGKNETFSEYAIRAMKKVAEKGLMDKVRVG